MTDSLWFVAVLVLQSRVGTWDDEPLVDRQVRLIQAPDAETAFERAVQIGQDQELSYKNEEGEQVAWEFLGLSELGEITGPKDGDEVFSWLTHGQGSAFVRKKTQLSAFADPTDTRTAREILDE